MFIHINRDLKTQYVPNWYNLVTVAKGKILRVLFGLYIFLAYDPLFTVSLAVKVSVFDLIYGISEFRNFGIKLN